MNMQKSITQFKRELWEHKTGFLWVPLALAVLWTLFASFSLVNYQSMALSIKTHVEIEHPNESPGEENEFVSTLEKIIEKDTSQQGYLADVISVVINIQNVFLIICFFIVLLTYAHSTLFDDRKSREILFWRSMPVGETQNVLTKLAMILVVAPGIMLLLNVACGLVVILVGGATLGSNGQFAAALPMLVTPIRLFGTTLVFLLVLLPVIGWVLFASAFAKKSPFLFSSLVPLLVLLLDRLLGYTLGISLQVKKAFIAYGEILHNFSSSSLFENGFASASTILQQGTVAIVIGCLLILATIWLRNNRYEL